MADQTERLPTYFFPIPKGATITTVSADYCSTTTGNEQYLQDHHAASALGAVPGLPVSFFSATSVDNAPYLAGLVPEDSEKKIIHPKASQVQHFTHDLITSENVRKQWAGKL